MGLETVILVENVHCPSCVSHVQDVLEPFAGVTKVDVSILTDEVRILHSSYKAKDFCSVLSKAAFDVHHASTYDPDGNLVEEYTPSHGFISQRTQSKKWSLFMSWAQKSHIDNCDACQKDLAQQRKSKSRLISGLAWKIRYGFGTEPKPYASSTDIESQQKERIAQNPLTSLPSKRPENPAVDHSEFEASLGIQGMTCASCSGKITSELESLDFVSSVNVNLIGNSGIICYRGTRKDAGRLIEAIEDVGYEATVTGLKEIRQTMTQREDTMYTASLSIEGMTCGACVGTITRGLQELPFVRSVTIDLVGNSGRVEYEKEDELKLILEKLEDLGYDVTVVSSGLQSTGRAQETIERDVTFVIDGMCCHHCPEVIEAAVRGSIGEGHVLQLPTLSDPFLTIKYIPSPPGYTMRTFAESVTQADEAISVKVYHPPSIEERSRKIQKREQRRVLARLVFSGLVAIPTFIIGIVYMSLVPKTNTGRMWLEQPIWSGSASRTEWALLIMTTPVMFFGADYFHTRTFKELRALWRPSSKVPIMRRFYRFGSMNLLISAGTAVAYFSSIAVLGLDASLKDKSSHSSSNTYFDSVTFLTFFILIGKFLEAYSKAKTGDAVSALSNLRPTVANLVVPKDDEGSTSIKTVTVDMLEVGDTVSVPHGTSPPSDGTIIGTGDYRFDESSLTGESTPVKKIPGDKVYTGSVNVGPPVQISVTDIGGNSMLDQIVSVVREGQAKRAPIERVADIITGYFVPTITLLAITTFVIWVSLGVSGKLPQRYLNNDRGGWVFWSLEFAIAVFVVACPCGIGLAAPTALFVGGGLAAQRGILVQGGGEAFQEASVIDAVVFDKTGTLTEGGSLKVTEHEVLAQENPEDLATVFKMAQVMEESSNHPIAKSIVDFCRDRIEGSGQIVSSDINELGGQGMRAKFNVKIKDEERQYEAAIGNQRLLSSLPSYNTSKDVYLKPLLSKYQTLGHSTTMFALRRLHVTSSQASDGQPANDSDVSEKSSQFQPLIVFAISDPIRPSSLPVLNALRDKYNIAIHMCTGDNATTAHAVASQLGIPVSNVRANCLPADKAAYINELQGVFPAAAKQESRSPSTDSSNRTTSSLQSSSYTSTVNASRRVIAFVGDGTNDTPALSASDVSIALSSGSDVAITTASFILLSSPPASLSSGNSNAQSVDLNLILELVTLAKRVFKRVKINFVWAAIYNILLIPVAAGVFFRLGDLDGNTGHGWRLGPIWASAAMAASSVSVVLSSLSLRWGEGRRFKKDEKNKKDGQ
ncbi:putative copper resistance-associated p-type [Phaeomoniella chlamydospora]|uniref:Putative copper resistance-associated P-type n=1 Tax=Phaeomoniella chlamydospora TaxID=158046 RepID=A0A0G2EKK9_PHACM|nr:putative copper resistance-associated p-type [Phaeomoniella chlamydospora]